MPTIHDQDAAAATVPAGCTANRNAADTHPIGVTDSSAGGTLATAPTTGGSTNATLSDDTPVTVIGVANLIDASFI